MPGTVFITGAARGVGRATAVAFAQAGADLLLTDLGTPILESPYPLGTLEQLEETARRCRALGSRTLTMAADVRSQGEVDAAVSAARTQFGQVEVLVNNAGLVGPAGKPAH